MTKKQQKKSYILQGMFIASLFLIIFVAGVTYKNYSNLSESARMVSHTYEVKKDLLEVLSSMKDAEIGLRGYIISNDSAFLKLYTQSDLKIDNALSKINLVTRDNVRQQQHLDELSTLINAQKQLLSRIHEIEVKNVDEDSMFIPLFTRSKSQMDTIRSKVHSMTRLEDELLASRKEVYANTINLAPILLYALTLIILLLMYVAYSRMSADNAKLRRYNASLQTNKELTDQAEVINHHGTWTWDVESDDFMFSDNLYRLQGEDPQSFAPTLANFLKFVHPDDVDEFNAAVTEMRSGGDMPFVEYRVVLKNGTIRDFKACAKSYEASDGSTKLLGVTTDVTTQVSNYKQLMDRAHSLELNNKELAAFNHMASHDLQEPLRKIQTFLSRLEEKEAAQLAVNGMYYINRMKSASQRMRMLIDDLLQYSRTNRTEKEYELYDAHMLLEASKYDLADLITQSDLQIIADPLPDMLIIPFQIQQLFTNLINNAIKYRDPGRPARLTITYEKVQGTTAAVDGAAPEDHYHKITFTDNGIGFNQEHAENIFGLFNRLHNKDDYSGTGIGLSICKKIVENHDGFIKATGSLGVGASFVVHIPCELL